MKYRWTYLLFAGFLIAGPTDFDPHRAFGYLEEQVNMGYRIPGTEDHLACRDWIIEKCMETADTVIVQPFKAYRPVTRDTVDAYNIIARFYPYKERRVMLSTHWDTRPFADLDPYYPDRPVPGANDGASGTAVLIELLRHIRSTNNEIGVDIVFWDAEDMGLARSNTYFCQGSIYYSHNPVHPVPQKGILIDMIGDHDLQIPIEENSMMFAPGLVSEVWSIARELGYQKIFPQKIGPAVYDDHVPLNMIAKIPTINLIDFHYVHQGRNLWHTTRDLPAFCSPQSLKYVGDVLLVWLSRQ
ncbi:MAG: M28 family peptidase [FCB group bacterium]|nr:M28 family peptidase [FCB group bacterium]